MSTTTQGYYLGYRTNGSPLNEIHQWNTETKLVNQRKSTQGIRVKTEEILLLRKHKAYFLKIQSSEMFLSHRVWKLLFHTTTKRQTDYSWFAIPISTIPVTKHPLFLKISLSLLPNALLCSLLPNFLLLLSPLLKPWISLPRRFFLYWSLKFERFGVWKCWFEIWFGF